MVAERGKDRSRAWGVREIGGGGTECWMMGGKVGQVWGYPTPFLLSCAGEAYTPPWSQCCFQVLAELPRGIAQSSSEASRRALSSG